MSLLSLPQRLQTVKLKKYSLVLLGLFLIFLVNCSPSSSPPLRIAIQLIWPSFGTAFIAQEKGLFAKYGIQVTLIPAAGDSGYTEVLKLYKEGKVDAAFMMIADALTLDAEGIPARIIYTVDYSDTSDVIVGHPSLKSLSDVKGKRVSFDGFNTFSHLLVLKLLEKAGVREGEFQTANMSPSQVLNALETGKIQAGHVYGTAATNTLSKGYKVLEKAGNIAHLMLEGLIVTPEIIKSRHEEVQKLVKALAEAVEWLQRSPKESLDIIAQHTDVPRIELENTLKGLHLLTLSETRESFKRDGYLFRGGQEIVDFFYQKGVLIKLPNLNLIIDDQFVKSF